MLDTVGCVRRRWGGGEFPKSPPIQTAWVTSRQPMAVTVAVTTPTFASCQPMVVTWAVTTLALTGAGLEDILRAGADLEEILRATPPPQTAPPPAAILLLIQQPIA